MSNVSIACGSDVGVTPGCGDGDSGGGGGGGGGITGDSLDGEDQDDSSSQCNADEIGDALASFREQWQRELVEATPITCRTVAHDCRENEEFTVEGKAKCLFMKGVENEQAGKLYEAIQFYRKAVQLVPDIEFKLYESSKQRPPERNILENNEGEVCDNETEETQELCDDNDDDADMLIRLQRYVNKTRSVCCPNHEQKGTHISELPMEIIFYILRWVVSSELDLRSLEMYSEVCRGFYVCARDPEIWRLACVRVWGLNCGGLSVYGSWREMFISRPKLHFNGCYISKTTYLRNGENSFQDQFYRPWHIVEYYRYLRFFPEGKVLMLTTPDDPLSSLGHLRSRSPRHQATLVGHYRLRDERVTIALHRQETHQHSKMRSRRQNNKDEQTFHLELKIVTYKSRVHAQLVWAGYSVLSHNWVGQETTTTFELAPGRFPPFWFSRVKSYTSESEVPLM
ncbi:F-box only protein 9 isoform X2 [Lycorma delicatula]|uniref:F-box only protein 9 isoform X2 n=1 Tax=Lycorma delicatula TaxID=130591 RepID=UPI003F517849